MLRAVPFLLLARNPGSRLCRRGRALGWEQSLLLVVMVLVLLPLPAGRSMVALAVAVPVVVNPSMKLFKELADVCRRDGKFGHGGTGCEGKVGRQAGWEGRRGIDGGHQGDYLK